MTVNMAEFCLWVCSSCRGSSALQSVESRGNSGGETSGGRGDVTGTETPSGPAGLAAHILRLLPGESLLNCTKHLTVFSIRGAGSDPALNHGCQENTETGLYSYSLWM